MQKGYHHIGNTLDKSWQRLTLPPVTAVPSALRGLTSLFGMERGGHPRYNHHKIFVHRCTYSLNASYFLLSIQFL